MQVRATEVTSGTTNSVTLASATTAGNPIVVNVLWSNTGSCPSPDSRGNAYASAAARTDLGLGWSEQVFFAKNIVGGPTTVTATFGTADRQLRRRLRPRVLRPRQGRSRRRDKSATRHRKRDELGGVTTTDRERPALRGARLDRHGDAGGYGWTTRSTAYGNRTQDRSRDGAGSYSATATQNGTAWVDAAPSLSRPTAAPATVPADRADRTCRDRDLDHPDQPELGRVDRQRRRDRLPDLPRRHAGWRRRTHDLCQDTGLTPGTRLQYAVRALDAAGNVSAQSPTASATTPSAARDTRHRRRDHRTGRRCQSPAP